MIQPTLNLLHQSPWQQTQTKVSIKSWQNDINRWKAMITGETICWHCSHQSLDRPWLKRLNNHHCTSITQQLITTQVVYDIYEYTHEPPAEGGFVLDLKRKSLYMYAYLMDFRICHSLNCPSSLCYDANVCIRRFRVWYPNTNPPPLLWC